MFWTLFYRKITIFSYNTWKNIIMEKDKFVNMIKKTKNPFFIKDILIMYLKKSIFLKRIYKNIDFLWVKPESEKKLDETINDISKISDIFLDEKSRDIYYKKRSPWCTFCTFWKWCTVVLSYKCHRDCFFCYEETPLDPKVVIDPYDKEDMSKIYSIIDSSFSNPTNKTLAITWWEPFLFKDKVYEILEYVNSKYPWKHTRIYTTGDIMNDEILTKLKSLELDEIRYSIKPWEEPNLKIYALTKKYIPTVMIEMPIQPFSKDYMIDIMKKIDEHWSIDWFNLNELTFNNLNPEKYKEVWYKLDIPKWDSNYIYHRYYDVSKIEIWVYGSKILCLELIKYFSKRKSSFFMHYCDLDTVSTHQYIYKKNNAISMKHPYSEITRFALHKVLRAYSCLEKIKDLFKENNINEFYTNSNYIETSVSHKELLKSTGCILAIIYMHFDYSYAVDFEIINI